MSTRTTARKVFPSPKTTPVLQNSPAAKTIELDEGVTLAAVFSKIKELEVKVQQQTDNLLPLVESVSLKLAELEIKLSKRIDEEFSLFAAKIAASSSCLASLEANMKKAEGDIECLKQQLSSVTQQRAAPDIVADAIAFGVPYTEGENLKSIFNQICLSIDFMSPQIRDIFRTKPSTATLNSAIVIKFHSPLDRNRTLRAFGDYRRRMKSTASLSAIGTEGKFHIYESLSKENRRLLQEAIKLRRERKLLSVYTMRGCVHVKTDKCKHNMSTRITCEEDLMQFR